jgi:hypothetical protein
MEEPDSSEVQWNSVQRGGWSEQVVDLAGQEPFQAAYDLKFGVAVGGPLGGVGLGAFIEPQPVGVRPHVSVWVRPHVSVSAGLIMAWFHLR